MNKLLVTNIDADMALAEAGFKKYQVPDIKLMLGNVFTGSCQVFSGSRKLHTKAIAKSDMNEARTVYASFIQAAQFIGGTLPSAVLRIQALIDR